MPWQRPSPSPHWLTDDQDGGHAATGAPSTIGYDESKSEGIDTMTVATSVQVLSIPTVVGREDVAVANPHKRRVYGPPRVSEAHKRERNRVTFKRFYHRKKQTLHELRQEEEALTDQCQQLLVAQPVSCEIDLSRTREASYAALVAHKDRLQAEHTALMQAAERDLSTRRLLGRLVDTLKTGPQGQPTTNHARIESLQCPVMPRDDDHATQRAIQELDRIHAEQDHTTTTDAFGWRCRYRPCGQSIEFTFTKTFTSNMYLSTQELATRTWQFCTQDSSHDRNASPSSLVRTRRQILETLDAGRRSLLYRCRSRPQRHQPDKAETNGKLLRAKSVDLVSLLRLVQPCHGFMVVSHSVETPTKWCMDNDSTFLDDSSDWYDVDDSDGKQLGVLLGAMPWEIRDQWVDELHWWRIEQVACADPRDPFSVEVSFAGRAALCLDLQSDAWFMELLRLVVQWEHAVIGAAPISCHHQR